MANIVTNRRKNSADAVYIRQRYTDENGNRRQAKIKCKDRKEADAILPEVTKAEKEGHKYVIQKPVVYRPKGAPKYGQMSSTYTDITVTRIYSGLTPSNLSDIS